MKYSKFYVYAYLNPAVPGEFKYKNYLLTYQPIYIGKGCGNRYLAHKNRFKIGMIKPMVIKVKENMTEKAALKLEKELIKHFELKLKGGSLENLMYGGTINEKEPLGVIAFAKDMFEEEEERMTRLQEKYLEELSKLPEGSIQVKKRYNKKYCYIASREGRKVKYKYIGKFGSKEVSDIQNSIDKREKYRAYLKRVVTDLISLQRLRYLLRNS